MSYNPSPSDVPAKKMITMNSADDIKYWTSKFGVTREQLQKAVDYVGGKETRVVDYLRAKGIIRF